MVYEWESGHGLPADAQKVGETISRLAHRSGGAVSSPAIVKEARKKRSPLHPLFTWDDSVAGELYRRHEATRVVRQLVVVQERPEGDLRRPAYYHVNYTADENGGEARQVTGYQSVDEVIEIPEARDSANEYLIAQYDGLRRRQQHLVDPDLFAPIWREIEEVRKRLDKAA